MALNPHIDDAGANAAAAAVMALCNGGFIDIMSGAQPAANGAATSNIVLNSVALQAGATVSVTALTFTITE
jgi:Flp pilus assembly protein CpaB